MKEKQFDLVGKTQPQYDKFLMLEYQNLSQAHYNTVDSISAFFKHYLIVISIPIALYVIFIKEKSLQGMPEVILIIGFSSLLIAIIGFLVCWYIINLRLDALLYARAVNGIRNYFTEKDGFDHYHEQLFRVMPRSKSLPFFFEWHYFLSVVLVFASINSFFGCLFYYALTKYVTPQTNEVKLTYFNTELWWWCGGIILLSLVLHIASYYYLSYYRENSYLKGRTIGIDIDGVLNNHRKRFCTCLKAYTGKIISPDDIEKIPVHECKKLNVSIEDEFQVFNHPDYWNKMPELNGAAKNLKSIKNILQYKIEIFTSRAWPDFSHLPEDKQTCYSTLWHCYEHGKANKKEKYKEIYSMTTKWLKDKGFEYNKFTLEWNSRESMITKLKNRYSCAKNRQIDVFVEDTLDNAIRLSVICKIVFLINHPYNQSDKLPTNVIRVKDWDDIYHYLRDWV